MGGGLLKYFLGDKIFNLLYIIIGFFVSRLPIFFAIQSYIFFYIVNNISSYSKDMAKNNNWNTPNLRRFDLDNFGLSIDPSYTGKDPFGFKAGSHHTHTKIGMINKKVKKVG